MLFQPFGMQLSGNMPASGAYQDTRQDTELPGQPRLFYSVSCRRFRRHGKLSFDEKDVHSKGMRLLEILWREPDGAPEIAGVLKIEIIFEECPPCRGNKTALMSTAHLVGQVCHLRGKMDQNNLLLFPHLRI